MSYSIEDCDRILAKIANAMAAPGQQPAMDPNQQMQQDPSALGTIGADLGGGGAGTAGGAGGGGGQGEGGLKVNKDQLYERIIQEKDALTRLKVQLAASGQLPPDMYDSPQGPPLEQQMQEGMSQDMMMQSGQQPQQPPMQDPMQGQMQPGMEVQAALKKLQGS